MMIPYACFISIFTESMMVHYRACTNNSCLVSFDCRDFVEIFSDACNKETKTN